MKSSPGKSASVVPGPFLLPATAPTALQEHRAALEALVDAHDELIAGLSDQGKAIVAGVMFNQLVAAKKVLGRIA